MFISKCYSAIFLALVPRSNQLDVCGGRSLIRNNDLQLNIKMDRDIVIFDMKKKIELSTVAAFFYLYVVHALFPIKQVFPIESYNNKSNSIKHCLYYNKHKPKQWMTAYKFYFYHRNIYKLTPRSFMLSLCFREGTPDKWSRFIFFCALGISFHISFTFDFDKMYLPLLAYLKCFERT